MLKIVLFEDRRSPVLGSSWTICVPSSQAPKTSHQSPLASMNEAGSMALYVVPAVNPKPLSGVLVVLLHDEMIQPLSVHGPEALVLVASPMIASPPTVSGSTGIA